MKRVYVNIIIFNIAQNVVFSVCKVDTLLIRVCLPGDTSSKVLIPSLGGPKAEQKKREQRKMSGKVYTRRK